MILIAHYAFFFAVLQFVAITRYYALRWLHRVEDGLMIERVVGDSPQADILDIFRANNDAMPTRKYGVK